jgi:hypothetical protein
LNAASLEKTFIGHHYCPLAPSSGHFSNTDIDYLLHNAWSFLLIIEPLKMKIDIQSKMVGDKVTHQNCKQLRFHIRCKFDFQIFGARKLLFFQFN